MLPRSGRTTPGPIGLPVAGWGEQGTVSYSGQEEGGSRVRLAGGGARAGGTWAPWRAMALAVACFPSHPPRASGTVQWKMREALGSLLAPVTWGTQLPSIPLGPARDGVQRGDRAGCGGEGGEGGRQESAKRPLGRNPAPSPPAGGRKMEAAVVRWRAGVQCGHEGHARSPRVCVRAWGWARPPPPCPGGAGRGAGPASLGSPCLPRWAAARGLP